MRRRPDATGRRTAAWLAAFSVLYFAPAALVAVKRPLWYDELFTLYLTELPRFADVRAFFATGVEPSTSLFYAASRAAVAVLGHAPPVLRLPEILGVWALCLCLYRFVSRRMSSPAGAAAMLFPLVTLVASFATEARPNGLVLGLGGLALVSWQRATDGEGRGLALAGLAASLAAAVLAHPFGVLLFVPFAAAELARVRGHRRLDAAPWAALGAGLLVPLLVLLPAFVTSRAVIPTFWAKPTWMAVVSFYPQTLPQASVALVALLALAALAAWRPTPAAPVPLPLHEVVLALGFVALPAVAVVLGKLVTGVFAPRYALTTIIGIAVLFGWAAGTVLGARRRLGRVFIALMVASVVTSQAQAFQKARAEARLIGETWRFLRDAAGSGSPIVIAHPIHFLQLAHYAPPEAAGRLVYLADPAEAVRYIGHDTSERALLELRRWAPVRVERYADSSR